METQLQSLVKSIVIAQNYEILLKQICEDQIMTSNELLNYPGRSFQQSDLIGSVSDSNRNPTKLDENFINRRNPIGFLVAIRHPDP